MRAACAVGVTDGSTVPTGVATIAMGCCCGGVCSALDDNSGNTYKTQITMLIYVPDVTSSSTWQSVFWPCETLALEIDKSLCEWTFRNLHAQYYRLGK